MQMNNQDRPHIERLKTVLERAGLVIQRLTNTTGTFIIDDDVIENMLLIIHTNCMGIKYIELKFGTNIPIHKETRSIALHILPNEFGSASSLRDLILKRSKEAKLTIKRLAKEFDIINRQLSLFGNTDERKQ